MSLLSEVVEGLYKYFDVERDSEKKLISTQIQSMLIPEVIYRCTAHEKYKTPIFCGAETGSGKTLAYSVPIIQTIKKNEQTIKDKNNLSNEELKEKVLLKSKLGTPKALIIAPSVELVDQIYTVIKKLSHNIKFRVIKINRHSNFKDISNRLNLPIDIVVSTPYSFNRSVESKTLHIEDLKFLVVDEADTLFDRNFSGETEQLIDKIETINKRCQTIFSSATIPEIVYDKLSARYSDVSYIISSKIHKPIKNSQHVFIDLKTYQGNRNLAFMDILRQYETREKDSNQVFREKILVFCNTRTSVINLSQYLRGRKIKCLAFYSCIEENDKSKINKIEEVQDFIYNKKERINSEQCENGELKNDNDQPLILISTDLASRGLDTVSIDHVIMYDFPKSVADYIHRSGRTARINQSGIVTSLVGLSDKSAAENIEKSIRNKKKFI